MFDVKLFRAGYEKATPIKPNSVRLEKDIQSICEQNLEVFFGVTLVRGVCHPEGQYRYKTDAGRTREVDTLGINGRGHPVVIEYKRDKEKTVVNQALEYAYWIEDRAAEFRELVRAIDPKIKAKDGRVEVICVANDFEGRDTAIAKGFDGNSTIDLRLVRYQTFDNDIVGFQQIYPLQKPIAADIRPTSRAIRRKESVSTSAPLVPTAAGGPQGESDNIYYLKGGKTDALVCFNKLTQEFVLKRGSVIPVRHAPSYSRGRRELLEKRDSVIRESVVCGEGVVKLNRDMRFRTSSGAASFALGRPASGPAELKDASGVNLKNKP